MIDEIQKHILSEIADLHEVPEGAYNLRLNGKSEGRKSSENIEISTNPENNGLMIRIKSGTVNESVHIPVVISESGLKEVVRNDFDIGDNCNVLIVAGCGIHNCGAGDSQHDGLHTFTVGKNSKVKYVEKHYGEGDGTGKRIFNPETSIALGQNSTLEMEMIQIRGVDSTDRKTTAVLKDGARLVVHERLMTHGTQFADSTYVVDLEGEGSSVDLISRSVARDESKQRYHSSIIGRKSCSGHSECDAIIMDSSSVVAIPELDAECVDAALIHEAAIGKIAGDQLIKLMTLGLSEQEAEEQIIAGFLK